MKTKKKQAYNKETNPSLMVDLALYKVEVANGMQHADDDDRSLSALVNATNKQK